MALPTSCLGLGFSICKRKGDPRSPQASPRRGVGTHCPLCLALHASGRRPHEQWDLEVLQLCPGRGPAGPAPGPGPGRGAAAPGAARGDPGTHRRLPGPLSCRLAAPGGRPAPATEPQPTSAWPHQFDFIQQGPRGCWPPGTTLTRARFSVLWLGGLDCPPTQGMRFCPVWQRCAGCDTRPGIDRGFTLPAPGPGHPIFRQEGVEGRGPQTLHQAFPAWCGAPPRTPALAPRVPGVRPPWAVLGRSPGATPSTDPLVPGHPGTEVGRRGSEGPA